MADTSYTYMGFLLDYKQYARLEGSATIAEVNKLESSLRVKLPLAYREALLILGMRKGFRLGPENSFAYPDFKGMQAAAEKIFTTGKVAMEKNDFVFCCFEETGFVWFFKLDEGPNPPVYEYEEYSAEYKKAADSLTVFVKETAWYKGYLLMKRDAR